MIPVETHDYTVFGDGYAEWDHYPHETTSEYMRGCYVRTEDADKAYDALTQENERLQQALAQAQQWQPYATAPRDGRWMLGWNSDCGCFVWRDGPGLITGEDPEPTHWIPIPDPPTGSTPTDGEAA